MSLRWSEVDDTGPSKKGETLRSESRAIGIIPWEIKMWIKICSIRKTIGGTEKWSCFLEKGIK